MGKLDYLHIFLLTNTHSKEYTICVWIALIRIEIFVV